MYYDTWDMLLRYYDSCTLMFWMYPRYLRCFYAAAIFMTTELCMFWENDDVTSWSLSLIDLFASNIACGVQGCYIVHVCQQWGTPKDTKAAQKLNFEAVLVFSNIGVHPRTPRPFKSRILKSCPCTPTVEYTEGHRAREEHQHHLHNREHVRSSLNTIL